ncbi:uncharacterized protein [Littorina saxatilis]|uniref:uncharacterized protein isoform X2 n=1 Tax=Littorina saxatilis TaxID=31220 RepID=UPI0038B443F9
MEISLEDDELRVEYANDNHVISLSLSRDNDVCQIQEGHPDEDDIVSFYAYRERPKTCRERVGECLVSVTCTGIVGLVLSLCVVIAAIGLAKIIAAGMFWRLCPVSPSLPTYLLVSGLMPTLFYVTCRTRRKYKGAVPGKQRIVARWEFSVLHYTFDTEKSWQAGLAAVLSVFLMIWLCYGTISTVLTMKRMEDKPANCVITTSQNHPHSNASITNATSHSSSSAAEALMSLSLSKANERSSPFLSAMMSSREQISTDERPPTRTPITLQPPLKLSEPLGAGTANAKRGEIDTGGQNDSSPHVRLSLVNGTINGHHIPRTNGETSANDSRTIPHSDQIKYLGAKPLEVITIPHVTSSTDASTGDVTETLEVTSSGKNSACLDCDKTFLTLCFSFVLFDWAYGAALLLNLIIVGTVPCCCFKRIAHV